MFLAVWSRFLSWMPSNVTEWPFFGISLVEKVFDRFCIAYLSCVSDIEINSYAVIFHVEPRHHFLHRATSGFLIQGRTRKPATHGGLPEGITDGNWRFRQYECVMIPRLCTMAWDG